MVDLAGDLGRRILVLIPHPDDEVVGCAALLGRARGAGARAFGLYLSTGIAAEDRQWPWRRARHAARIARRRAEAERAASALGLEAAGFLDAPSRTLSTRLDAVLPAVREALTRVGADAIWVPAFEGGHQDHDSANALAAVAAANGGVPAFEFAEYNLAGGRVRTNAFPAATGDERVLALTPTEADAKRRLLALYRSERLHLAHVRTAREAIRPLPAHDYACPPHAGRLYCERFRWVPFGHPSIDRAAMPEVRRRLAAFVARHRLDRQGGLAERS